MNETIKTDAAAIAGSNMLLPDFKSGYVWRVRYNKFEVLLQKDFELDEILTLNRDVLTERQNELFARGSVVRYDKTNNKIEFLSESGQIWL